MTEPTIRVEHLSKRFGSVDAVADLSFEVAPGRVTGFLGPNGAGKTTTLRMLVGLVRPSAGTATINGRPYASLADPLKAVGVALEANTFAAGRSARNHLLIHAAAGGIDQSRVDEVLGIVGLSQYAKRSVGGFSLGMRQRLGLATALLGDPDILLLDEPINGLDPEGIKWIRSFLSYFADQGKTVFLSSHLLAELQQAVQELVIISAGRLVFSGSLDELSARATQNVVVRSPDQERLQSTLSAAGFNSQTVRHGLRVEDATAEAVGHAAYVAGVELSLLVEQRSALEDIFLSMTGTAAGDATRDGQPAVAPVQTAVPPTPAQHPLEHEQVSNEGQQ